MKSAQAFNSCFSYLTAESEKNDIICTCEMKEYSSKIVYIEEFLHAVHRVTLSVAYLE